MRELEVKLAVGETFVMPDFVDQDGITAVRDLPEQDLGSVYHDTADLRLARHGVTLRYRIGEEEGPRWTLKIPRSIGGNGLDREELSFESGPADVPSAVRELVAAWVRRAPLTPSAALRTRRRRILLIGAEEREIAEIANDEVSVLDGEAIAARFRELEVEARAASPTELRLIARRLQQAGAGRSEPVPKYMRAIGPRATAAPDIVVPEPGPDAQIGEAVAAALARDGSRLVAQHAPTLLEDAEGLHQMRVAARRLRTDLRTFRPFLDGEWADGLDAELAWLADLLAAVRDADVHLAMIQTQGSDLQPGLAAIEDGTRQGRDDAWRALTAELAGSRYLDLLDRLVSATRAPLLARGDLGRADRLLAPQIEAAAKKVEAAVNRFTSRAPDRAFHRIRIRTKRLRYAAETAMPYADHGRGALAKIAEKAANLQDHLGLMQDAVTLRDQLSQQAEAKRQGAAAAFAAGRLAERQEADRVALRKRFPKKWRPLRKAIRGWNDAG